jgi:hypothetical protein
MSSWSCSVASGVVLAVAIAGCGADPSPRQVAGQPVVLEVDVFSGAVNPTWSLSEEQTRRLERVVGELRTTAACPAPARDGLGFRGFGVEGLYVAGAHTRRVDVDTDCVRVRSADGSNVPLLDEARSTHRLLAEVAYGHNPALRQLVTER